MREFVIHVPMAATAAKRKDWRTLFRLKIGVFGDDLRLGDTTSQDAEHGSNRDPKVAYTGTPI